MGPLAIGVIGVGDVAQRDYLPEFARLGDAARLAAVSSREGGRARDAALRFGAGRWSTDWRDLLAADVDIVVNLTPIQAHLEITLAAIERGKHVYSEKPLAPDRAGADRIREAAHSNGVVVVAAPSILLFPQVAAAAGILASSAFGPPVSVRTQVFGGVPPWDGYISNPTPYFVRGGGPLRDMGVYPLHAVTGLLGPVRLVTAMSRRTRPWFVVTEGPTAGRRVDIRVDDDWHLLAELHSGIVVSLYANFSARGSSGPELEILGSGGGLALSLLDVSAPIRFWQPEQDDWVDIPVAYQRAGGGPDHLLGVAHLVDCVRSGRSPIPSIEHAAHVIDVIAAAERSATEGRAIAIDSSFPSPTLS